MMTLYAHIPNENRCIQIPGPGASIAHCPICSSLVSYIHSNEKKKFLFLTDLV